VLAGARVVPKVNSEVGYASWFDTDQWHRRTGNSDVGGAFMALAPDGAEDRYVDALRLSTPRMVRDAAAIACCPEENK